MNWRARAKKTFFSITNMFEIQLCHLLLFENYTQSPPTCFESGACFRAYQANLYVVKQICIHLNYLDNVFRNKTLEFLALKEILDCLAILF